MQIMGTLALNTLCYNVKLKRNDSSRINITLSSEFLPHGKQKAPMLGLVSISRMWKQVIPPGIIKQWVPPFMLLGMNKFLSYFYSCPESSVHYSSPVIYALFMIKYLSIHIGGSSYWITLLFLLICFRSIENVLICLWDGKILNLLCLCTLPVCLQLLLRNYSLDILTSFGISYL